MPNSTCHHDRGPLAKRESSASTNQPVVTVEVVRSPKKAKLTYENRNIHKFSAFEKACLFHLMYAIELFYNNYL
jgi:hypothetical protein